MLMRLFSQGRISVLRIFVLQNHINLEAIVDFGLEDLSSEAEFYSAARAVGLRFVC
jgi:hypothetical protein